MSLIPNYVPNQYKTVNVSLVVKDAEKALEFYNRAFGAEAIMKMVDPNSNRVVHAEFKIADTIIMMSEELPEHHALSPESLGGTSCVIQLYTGDVEALFEESLKAGAVTVFPIKEQFYGDRAGRVKDPFGHHWILATHVEDMTFNEMQKRFRDLYA